MLITISKMVDTTIFLFILLWLKLLVLSSAVLFALITGFKAIYEPQTGYCKCTSKMNGKTVLITGGNSGIGYETALELAKRGARVVIASRDSKKSALAVKRITQKTGNEDIVYQKLDLSSLDGVKNFVQVFRSTEKRLDVLICNAGAGGLKFKLSKDGIDKVMQINYLSHFLLTNLLLDLLVASKPSRVVIVSSLGHKFARFNSSDLEGLQTFCDFYRYMNSKLCCVLWARALSYNLPKGITAYSLHPGIVKTHILKNLPILPRNFLLAIFELFFKNAKEGAQTSIHLCLAPIENLMNGGYYRDCEVEEPSKLVYDEKLVHEVWTESVRLTKKFM